MQSKLDGCIIDTPHSQNIEIMSPSYMNQRKILDGASVIPTTARLTVPAACNDTSAEEIVFDKAERAEKLENEAFKLNKEMSSLENVIKKASSEETWRLGEELPLTYLLTVFMLSIVFLGFFAYESVFQGNIKYRGPVFLWRISIAYTITAIVVALVLFSLNTFPLLTDTVVVIKWLIVITMSAAMGAIIVESFDKE